MTKQLTAATVLLILAPGCAATRKTGEVVAGATAWLAVAMIDGLFDNGETPIEQHHRKQNERRWKQAWRAEPNANPAMTAAFKNDYQ